MLLKKIVSKRIILIGDSAIEGAGYDYEFTIGGLLQIHLEEDYEVLEREEFELNGEIWIL